MSRHTQTHDTHTHTDTHERSANMKTEINDVFNTPQKRRCRDCCYLIEDDNGNWVCDDCGKEIHEIPDDECSAEHSF